MSKSKGGRQKRQTRKDRALYRQSLYAGLTLEGFSETEYPNYTQGLNKEIFDCLEDMMGHIHKRVDPKINIDRLRLCFCCAPALFRADRFMMEELGVNHLDALLLSLVPDLARYSECTSYGEHTKIGRLQDAADYLISNFIGLQDEHFYLFCVNQHGRLKARVLLHKGIEDRALFSLNRLVTEVLRADPAAIIVSHNHPRGTMRPSEADILCTEDIINAVTSLNVPLLDHIIVANDEAVSLRDNGYIPEAVWLAQAPDNYYLRTWLQPAPPPRPKKPKVLTPEERAAAIEKQRQTIIRRRKKKMEAAQRVYRSNMRKAENALRIYQNLCAQEERSRKK